MYIFRGFIVFCLRYFLILMFLLCWSFLILNFELFVKVLSFFIVFVNVVFLVFFSSSFCFLALFERKNELSIYSVWIFLFLICQILACTPWLFVIHGFKKFSFGTRKLIKWSKARYFRFRYGVFIYTRLVPYIFVLFFAIFIVEVFFLGCY